MASELAQDSIVPPVDGGDAPSQPNDDMLMVNGSHESTNNDMSLDAPPNQEAFSENAALPSTKETPSTQIDAPATADADPAESAPVENVSAGIAPVSDFVPKDVPNLSHPTPPPDQPLATDTADVDTEMQDQPAMEPASLPESLPDATPAEPEQAVEPTPIVESAEPAHAKADESLLNGVTTSVEPTPDVDGAKPAAASAEPAAQDSAPSSLVRSRDEFEGDSEPAAKRAKLEDPKPSEGIDSSIPQAPVVSQSPAPVPETALPTSAPPAITPAADSAANVLSAPAVMAAPAPVASAPSAAAPAASKYSTTPVTAPQRTYLIEKLKNNKKTKHASSFLDPVDPVKLNIPTYTQIITQPMDLGTIEAKLKADQYPSVQAFADDFNLMVDNARKFNGENHVVTVAALNMQAYFQKFMQNVPSADAKTPVKSSKKQSPAPKPAPRREQRPIPPPPPRAPATMPDRSNADTFALQADGTPQIRRDSSTKRPARAIKPPTRDLTYAKPKRKEHQLELKFCEHVLDEVRGPKYGQLNHVFLVPVDPVALNIPQYRQIIKDPMDLSTMAQKLKQGQYSKAKEFKSDFELMIENCLKFNPHGNPVRDLGIQFRREFERLWGTQSQWESANKPKSERNSSAGDSDADESDDDEEDEEENANAATIAQLSQQLALMQNQLAAAIGQSKAPKNKKPKDGSKKKKQKSFSSAPVPKAAAARPAPKAKPKKPRPVSYEEKQEISSAVEQMNEGQIEVLTQIITTNCEKYRNMGAEMELEIDDLPDEVQRLLLKHVRSIFGKKATARVSSPEDAAAMDDDDFEPSERAPRGGGGAAKRKKHKPMGKREQQDSINALKNQLAAYSAPISDSASPTSASYAQGGQGGDTSGDDESEESEEE